LVFGVLPGEFKQWGGDDGEVLDMLPEEVAESQEGSDSFHVVRWSRLFDILQLGLPWLGSFRS